MRRGRKLKIANIKTYNKSIFKSYKRKTRGKKEKLN